MIVRISSIRLLLLTSVVLSLIACDPAPSKDTRTAQVRPVKLIEIGSDSMTRVRRFPATIVAAQSSELTFQVSGLLQELPVSEAQEVKAGDILAQLDQRDYQISVNAAKAQYNNAKQEYQRAQRLLKEDAISRSVVEQRKSQRDTAKAELDTANKALSDTALRAPFDGVISQVFVENFQNVQAGKAIVSMIGQGSMQAAINLPASIIATVPKNSSAQISVILEAQPDSPIEAKFKEASLEADPVSQTYEVQFSFTPPENLNVLPGMNASVIIESASRNPGDSPSVAVPLHAILAEGDQQFVWVVDPASMQVSKRAVTIKPGIGETVVVTGGLAVGEIIAGAGAAYLAEGLKVRAWDEQ